MARDEIVIDGTAERLPNLASGVVALDELLAQFHSTRGQRSAERTELLLREAARFIVESKSGANTDGPGFEEVLADTACERLAVAFLVRLLGADDSALDGAHSIAGRRAFDRALGSTYPMLEIQSGMQWYDKKDRLRTRYSAHEESLLSHTASLRSLDALPEFRQEFGRLFSSPFTRLVVLPFLPEAVTKQTFSELLSAAAALSENQSDLLDRAAACRARCDEARELARSVPTRYSIQLLEGLADRVDQLCEEAVRAAGLADPAELNLVL